MEVFRKTKHQGLGTKQLKDQLKTERKILLYLSKHQPAYVRQIVKECGVKDAHAVVSGLERLLGKRKIKTWPDPQGPKNKKYYVLRNYQSAFSPSELEGFEFLKKFPRISQRFKLDPLTELTATASLASDIYLPDYIDNESADPRLRDEIKRIFRKENKQATVTVRDLKYMIIISETIRTKRHVCKVFGISTKAFDWNVKRYCLQSFQTNLRKLVTILEKHNMAVIPYLDSKHKLQLGVFKIDAARKRNLI